jgi:autotransporter translocation and assembly factor TamB
MRIHKNEDGTFNDGTDATTRGGRARANAVARLEARHVERDYLGRPLYAKDVDETAQLTPAAAKRAADGTSRLDARLVADGLAPSRDKAKALIAAGSVLVDGTSARLKASTPVAPTARVELRLAE